MHTKTQKRSQNVNVILHRKSSIQNVNVGTCIDRIILGTYTYLHTHSIVIWSWMGLRCQSLKLVQYFYFLIFSCPILQLWKLNTFYDSFSFSQSSCQVRFIDTHVHYMYSIQGLNFRLGIQSLVTNDQKLHFFCCIYDFCL